MKARSSNEDLLATETNVAENYFENVVPSFHTWTCAGRENAHAGNTRRIMWAWRGGQTRRRICDEIIWTFDPRLKYSKGHFFLKFWLRYLADLVDTVGGAWKLLGYWGSGHSWFRWSTRQFGEEGFRDHETLVSPFLFLLELLQPGLLLVRSHPEMKMINAKPAWPCRFIL